MNSKCNCLFITEQYFPFADANGACVRNIVNELKNDNFFVDVIALSNNEHSVVIDALETIHFIKCDSYKESIISRLFAYPIRNIAEAKSYYYKFESLFQKKKYSLILFAINPIESIFPLLKIKSDFHTIKVIYELDSISSQSFNKRILSPLLLLKSRKLEKRCYKKADYIIHMECHKAEFEKKKYNSVRSKFRIANFPVIISKKANISITKKDIQPDDYKHFLFCGSLNKGIRNPIPCLKILEQIGFKGKYVFDFFTKGDYEEELIAMSKKGHIVPHGYVKQEELETYITKSSFLISIGNLIDNFVPSKLYSYLSYKKPIIHFYEKDNDPCLRHFSNIAHCLFIDVRNNQEENLNKILDFINKDFNLNKFVIPKEFDYCRPEYTAKILESFLGDNESDK